MLQCPDCKSTHFDLVEVEFRPRSGSVYAIVCQAKDCGKVIGLHEKGIYDVLCEIRDILSES